MKRTLCLLLFLLAVTGSEAQTATPQQFSITWTAPTANTDGTPISGPISYQLYAGAPGQEVKFGAPVTSPPYLINPVPAAGTTECVQITAIVAGVESAKTPEICAGIPALSPAPPSNVKCSFTVTPSGATTATVTVSCK